MDNQKEIQNMIEIVEKVFSSDYNGDYESGIKDFATRLIQNNVKILTEDSVVLTREEYKMMIETQKHLEKKYSDMRDELNFYKNANEIVKQNYIQLKQDNEQARKETAREIFKELKVKLKGYIGLNYLDELAKQYGVE